VCGFDLPGYAETDGNFLQNIATDYKTLVHDYRPLQVAINTMEILFLAMMGKVCQHNSIHSYSKEEPITQQ
jgi:hypothetical protein